MNKMFCWVAVAAVTGTLLADSESAFHVDFARGTGPIKRVNEVGQPPLRGWDDDSMFHYLTEAGIGYSRLHDVGGAFGKNLFVDIPNVFRDFEADENDPKSYDFAFTDVLLKKMMAAGIRPFYRLGVTIENAAARVKPYRIKPPADYAKWARICEHVIAHYNEGWADGFRYGIEHWEIWNEPDDHLDGNPSFMWHAPFEEYVKLYGVTATHLKKRFPDIKICGFGSCGYYGANHPLMWGEKGRAQVMNFITCTTNFLAAVKREGWPLDMFTFHSYDTVDYLDGQVRWIRKTLDTYGFKDVELNLDEWLVGPAQEKLGTAQQAAEIAAALAILQNGPIDMAMLYDARCGLGNYSPLFNPLTRRPHKAYWAFYAFNELKKLGTAAALSGELPKGVWATAATDTKTRGALLVANTTPRSVDLDLAAAAGGWKIASTQMTDRYSEYCPFTYRGKMPPESVMMISFERDEGGRR